MPANSALPKPGEDAVTVRFGNVPERLAGATTCGPAYQVAPGRLLLHVPNVGRYLVCNGREILVQRAHGASDVEVQLFLCGAAFGALLHQRHVLPLHASCIRVADGAVAFAGPSGAGKSTLAAFLQQREYEVLTDDICAVHVRAGRGVCVSTGFGRLKLWSDALEQLGWNRNSLTQTRSELRKYERTFEHVNSDALVPLKRVYVLHEANDARAEGIEPLTPAASLRALVRQTYRLRFLEAFGFQKLHFQACAAVISSVPVYRLRRTWDLDHVSKSVEVLEDHWDNLSSDARASRRLAA